MVTENLVRIETVIGSRRLSNYVWTGILFLGGLGFILAGLSSFLKVNLLFFANPIDLIFIPQGIVMLFYGCVALSLSIYIFLTILWDIGGGYNEYNKKDGLVRIIRKGFPGKNREILLTYPIDDIKAIKVDVQDGLNPKRSLYLKTKDNREIPLSSVSEPRSLTDLEDEALSLADRKSVV